MQTAKNQFIIAIFYYNGGIDLEVLGMKLESVQNRYEITFPHPFTLSDSCSASLFIFLMQEQMIKKVGTKSCIRLPTRHSKTVIKMQMSHPKTVSFFEPSEIPFETAMRFHVSGVISPIFI